MLSLLVRERSALADPYCQSAWNSVGLFVCWFASASFSGPLLSVEVDVCESVCLLVRERSALADPYCQSAWNSVGLFVCVPATLRSNISETKGDRG